MAKSVEYVVDVVLYDVQVKSYLNYSNFGRFTKDFMQIFNFIFQFSQPSHFVSILSKEVKT